jgi:hypothetical protein
MMNQSYQPKPLDTEGAVLPAAIEALTEKLAEHAHDTWAALRMQEGWRHGPVRNDRLKQHPCLVPYAELPESEKQYDRNTAIQTLKAILALGYRIEKT